MIHDLWTGPTSLLHWLDHRQGSGGRRWSCADTERCEGSWKWELHVRGGEPREKDCVQTNPPANR